MPEPTEKAEEIEIFLKEIYGVDRRDLIRQGVCMPPPIGCGRENVGEEFRDEVSRQEYRISGLCQKCQDSIWPV